MSTSFSASSNVPWQKRLAIVVESAREMSRQTDPQEMVRAYGRRMRQLIPVDGMVSLSRRDLDPPFYRITRSSLWKEEINPWQQKDRLPILSGGLLGDLLYGDEPRIIDEVYIGADDPGACYLEGFQSLMAIPHYDRGMATNLVVLMRKAPRAFDRETFPEQVWLASLFGRATQNLVLSEQVREAYELVDLEMRRVADIQRSLLPARLPAIPGVDLAASYATSRRAGGDYYDFFELPDNRWGILIADVSGHGTPAAVMMAITHSIAHSFPGPPMPPSEMLNFVNAQLARRYTGQLDSFVTAFYGTYHPPTKTLVYSSAGHNPPRLKRAIDGAIVSLDDARTLPLGIGPDEAYLDSRATLSAGDQLVFYTDGITEAQTTSGALFGFERLDQAIHSASGNAAAVIDAIQRSVDAFTSGAAITDDRTLLVAKIA